MLSELGAPLFPKLATGSFAVYKWSLDRDGFAVDDVAHGLGFDFDESEEIVADLLELQLIQPSRFHDAWFVPADPDIASSRVLTLIELDLLERKLKTNELRNDFAQLLQMFRSSKFAMQHTNPFDIVTAPETARLLLSAAAANSSHEVVCMQPADGRSAEELLEAQTRDLQMLDRGVRLRVLHQHAAQFDTPTREHAGKLIDSGAEIRTAGTLVGKMIIFDRSTAYLPLSGEDGGAVVVQERSLVECLYSCFENIWATSEAFDTRRSESDAISGGMKNEIVKMLISGAKDEAIARHLGMSVRTCRKHIGQVMQTLGAMSRFQFGYLVKESNLGEDA